jgi:hypothetical protein
VVLGRTDAPLKHWFLQQPQDVTSQKTAFFIVTTMKISNLTYEAISACFWREEHV